ncbi:MAG TPA: amino acid adenylation domain-containing protein, partial [Kutzneria sp.]|nr:amino acid adenylation domain-containing protein [Kutzneria sp.]
MTSTIEAPVRVPWSAVPLSAEQQGLLYLHQLEPDSARYHVPVAFELVGELDVPALERALKSLVRRHPLLAARTGADPTVLDADPERTIPLERKTFHGSSNQVVELLQRESVKPLDVENAGMTRAVLVTSTEDRHHLMLVVHHVVLDGEASGVLVADLWSLYTAERNGTAESAEPAVPAHAYADHIAARQSQQDEQELRAYWQEVLKDGCGPVELPSDGPADKATADVVLEFDAERTAAVNSFARKQRVGVFPVLLAAFQRTLAQFARQQRVAVAVPVSTRHDPALDRAVGCFVNTVLVRSPENPELDRAEYVRAVRTEVARAIDHAALPYPRIAELAPGVDFNCVFTYQSWFEPGGFGDSVPGLRIKLVEQVHQPVVGDLTLELFADGDRIRGRLRYATDKFAAATAASFARQLVANACGEQVTVHVDDTAIAFDEQDDIHWSLRRAAKENADRIALQEGGRRWTYAELDAETAERAAGLRANGVNVGDTVGLWLPRSAEQVIAVLSVLRAGAVFVPLDPAHPDHRLDDIARRAQLALVIREANDRPTPAGLPGVELSALDGPAIDDVPPRADQPAYVLFTSGSTGVPKGVVVGHRAFVNHLAWSKRYFDVTPDDAMAFSGTLSFDVTLHQLFVPLVCGARLVVVPDGEHRDADKMAATLNRHGVTLLHVVPALLRLLVDSPTFAENRSLRAVVSAGEALTNHLRRAFKDVQSARLYNAYGPTEATVYATVFDATDDNDARWTGQADVPIGEALDNIRCHVLDEQLRPVPDGAPGELCLSGVALADGYHGDPERTAEQFVGTDERIYRTGDLVRRLPEGGLSYLGRLDHQVKLNGFRVELGEVEAAMLAAPGVRDAVAVVRKHENGHSQLLGYVAPECDAEKVRAIVAQRLPGYMVPVHVVALPELPRLPSGKTDRKALPEPVVTTTPVVKAVRPKAGALDLVRTVWTEVIGRAPADDEHFFEAGGDSILAMQLVSKLRRAGCTVDVRDLHRTPVLADLAANLHAPEVEVPTGERFLAPIQSWFLDTVHTDRHHWNQSVLLELTRPIDPLLLGLALQAIVNAHPALSMRLADRDIVDAPPFTNQRPKDVLDSVRYTGPESIVELQQSLDPEAGVLLKARHLRDGDHESLLIAIHHLAVDGVSWRILLDDLDSAVAALEQGELPRLPDEGQSYRSWLDGLPALAADAPATAYWRAAARRRQTADTLVRMGSTGIEGDARRVELTLDEPATSALLGRIPAALGMPVHDVLTGLVALALGRWRGCGSVTFDVETHGRQTATGDVSRTVGWFTALYPVATTVDRTLAPADHLRAIR